MFDWKYCARNFRGLLKMTLFPPAAAPINRTHSFITGLCVSLPYNQASRSLFLTFHRQNAKAPAYEAVVVARFLRLI